MRMEKNSKKLNFKRFFKCLGPGFITGASDDDPSGIATYAQTGAIFGYKQLWLTVLSFPLMVAIQEMCGKIGLVTGKGLSGVIRSHYGRVILFGAVFLLLLANIVNIGADLGAMASSARLLFDIPIWAWLIFFTVLILLLQIFVPYKRYVKVLKYLSLSLFAYILTSFFIEMDWSVILKSTFTPSFIFSESFAMNVVAFLGTTISPYLFFWQTSEEVEEEVVNHKIRSMGKGVPNFTRGDIREMKVDTIVGMFFSSLIAFFIIAVTAATLHQNGITNIETADQAALALLPFAGHYAFLLFAVGIIGTGLLAIPILAGSASYAISEALKWKEGLNKKFRQARGFYGVIIFATLLGLFINFSPLPPFKMLYYAAVLNGICAPPLLFFILHISNNKKIMGKYTNSRALNILGWLTAVLMSISVIFLFYFMFF